MYARELIFFICHKTKTILLYSCCISVIMIVGLNAQSAGRYALILYSTLVLWPRQDIRSTHTSNIYYGKLKLIYICMVHSPV